uniref:Ornitho-kinin n=1 Tax=Gallus gallus TaxID=9031 RepID=Q7LZ50_CHICK|nr:ornitho kinin [Gallus gallus]
RPPGFTPLR